MSDAHPHLFSIYTDEPFLGMDHPLYMAWDWARFAAEWPSNDGTPIERAIPELIARGRERYGADIPGALISVSVLLTYARLEADRETKRAAARREPPPA